MSALEKYSAKKLKSAKAWAPPTIHDFRWDFKILSFDQSLAATGWVDLQVKDSGVVVCGRGTLRTKTDLKGVMGTLDRAAQLSQALNEVRVRGDFPGDIIAESPAVFGHRTESSLMALREVDRYVTYWWRQVGIVSIQHSRTLLAGPDARDDKKAGHEALVQWIPESDTRHWNEHQRDAAINALARLIELQREG